MGSATLLAAVTILSPAAVSAKDFGKPGEKVDLVIGFQPYYSESWSGVVNSSKQFWKKYLPEGSTATFQVGLQGAIIVNAMTGEKQDIGYVGDMPGIAATFRNRPDRGGTDIRIVAAIGTSKQQCNIFMVRTDAPEFADGKAALKWMDGKIVSSPHGSCTDRFARLAFEQTGITPGSYLNQNIEVITTNFRAGKLDATVIWEPTASKIAAAGLARRVASGEDFDALDGGLMIMLNDLIQQRPDVVKGWLNSELDAQLFVADLNNATAVSEMAEEATEQIDRKVLWSSLYGAPEGSVKVQFDFAINDRVKSLLKDATAFLYSLPKKPAASEAIREDGIMPQFAEEILKERGLTSPVGTVIGQPDSAYK
ncbi:MAG: nitrate ABC transporter substrate-binding protein [Alphaproteobacteria bacterium BRH_c36]|nr:MAG: nitrate ABC transporter substrate-binding protein [Alphaproteobacteria bacterium BRH_c36]